MQELVLHTTGTLEGRASEDAEQTGVRLAFDHYLVEFGPLAFRVAMGVLRNPADAEDVAQEALFRAHRKFPGLREPSRFRAWIVRVTFRLALDRSRSARRRELRETAWSRPEHRPAPPTVEQIALANEFQLRLERALDQLPDKFRIVLLLSAIQGYTLEEVSGLLEIPLGTVKSRLFFARKYLAEKLK